MRASYVLGFLFSPNSEEVVLLRKEKPDWQKGLFNGVGGKIEPGEGPDHAMVREFYEETGLMTFQNGETWEHYASIVGENYEAFVYRGWDSLYKTVTTKTDEHVGVYPVRNLPRPIIHNLLWLIPLALDPRVKGPMTFHDAGGLPHPQHNVWLTDCPVITESERPSKSACDVGEEYIASLTKGSPFSPFFAL